MKKCFQHAIASLLCTAVGLTAQTSPDAASTLLDEVVVTATRTEETIFETPYTAHLIGNERFLGERLIRTLSDALSETPGVFVQKSGYGQASPFIRGFTGFRTLLLIDGVRLNNAVFREGPNQYFSTIDQFAIDRLEIVKGPSSALYGSDAIGGTINAITRGPEMLPWPGASEPLSKGADGKTVTAPFSDQRFAFHPAASYRYASAENSHTARGEFSFSASPRSGMLGGVTWKEFGELRGGDTIGLQANTAYREIDGDMKLHLRPAENVDVTAAFYRVEQNNVPRTHSTKFAKSFDGTIVGTDLRRDFDQLRELAYLQAEWREVAPWLDRVRVSLSFHRQSEEQDRIRSTGAREVVGFKDDQYGALLTFVSPSPVGTLTYGAEYYHDAVQSWGSDWNPDGSLRAIRHRGPVADDASYDLLGFYLQDVFKPAPPLEVTLGARYSWANVEASGEKIDPIVTDAIPFDDLDKSFSAFTASLRMRLDVTRDWNFFGGASQGFRAPNLSDFTTFELAESGDREAPAAGLDPERFLSFEIGTKARVPRLGAGFYAAYFYTLVDDQIVRFPSGNFIGPDREITRANAGDGYIHGVELGAEWNVGAGFTLFGNLSWTEGELDTFPAPGESARRPATRIQPLTGLAGLRWQSADQKWFVEGIAQLARHQDRLAPTDLTDTQRIPPGGPNGYQVFSLRASYQPSEQLRLFAAVENIANEDYRHLGSGINEPGTNLVFGTHLRF